VGSVLARVVEGLCLAEVPKCVGSGLTQMESGPGEFHMAKYRERRIPELLPQTKDLSAK
jgi:hypothetical protein